MVCVPGCQHVLGTPQPLHSLRPSAQRICYSTVEHILPLLVACCCRNADAATSRCQLLFQLAHIPAPQEALTLWPYVSAQKKAEETQQAGEQVCLVFAFEAVEET